MAGKNIIQSVRGVKDILPAEQKYWDFVKKTVNRLFRMSGFLRIDTPILENTQLFVRSVGEATDIVEKEMYTFSSKGSDEKSISLRPEFTAGVCRAYIQHGMQTWPQPVSLYYLGQVFRHDKPQAGRLREFSQFGCEVFGDGDPVIDAGVISLAWEICEKLGLQNLNLEINSIGCAEDRPRMKRLIAEHYRGRERILCDDCRKRLKKNPFRLLDCKEERCQTLIASTPQLIDNLCDDCSNHFRQVLEYLDELNIPYSLNPRLVRGLDYYTRTVFEIISPEEKRQATLAAGGRYDLLIGQIGGNDTPAFGFSGGIERTILEMIRQKVAIEEEPEPVQIFVISLGDLAKKKCLKIIKDLRSEGFGITGTLSKESLKAQLKTADKIGALFALILGQREAVTNSIIIRNMHDGVQEIVEIDDLSRRLHQMMKEERVEIKSFQIPETRVERPEVPMVSEGPKKELVIRSEVEEPEIEEAKKGFFSKQVKKAKPWSKSKKLIKKTKVRRMSGEKIKVQKRKK